MDSVGYQRAKQKNHEVEMGVVGGVEDLEEKMGVDKIVFHCTCV